MTLGLTYPRTSSDGEKPVTAFKLEIAKVIRHMASKERQRCITTLSRARDIHDSQAKVGAYITIADWLDNIVIEGE